MVYSLVCRPARSQDVCPNQKAFQRIPSEGHGPPKENCNCRWRGLAVGVEVPGDDGPSPAGCSDFLPRRNATEGPSTRFLADHSHRGAGVLSGSGIWPSGQ